MTHPPDMETAPTLGGSAVTKEDLEGNIELLTGNASAHLLQGRGGVGQLIDKYGHLHTEAIFLNWSPAAIRALGIHRVGDEPKGGGA